MTDHRKEAADMLDGSNRYGSPTEALAHATLALVEHEWRDGSESISTNRATVLELRIAASEGLGLA